MRAVGVPPGTASSSHTCFCSTSSFVRLARSAARASGEGCDAGVLRYCLYDGTHGVWPPQPAADALIWAFFKALAP